MFPRENDNGLLMAGIPVSARGLDNVFFAVCGEAPADFVTIAVTNGGDAEGINARMLHVNGEIDLLELVVLLRAWYPDIR